MFCVICSLFEDCCALLCVVACLSIVIWCVVCSLLVPCYSLFVIRWFCLAAHFCVSFVVRCLLFVVWLVADWLLLVCSV